MNIFHNRLPLGLLGVSVLVFGLVVPFVDNVYAQIKPKIIVHVPKEVPLTYGGITGLVPKTWTNSPQATIQKVQQNLVAGNPNTGGNTQAQQIQMQKAITDGDIQVLPDQPSIYIPFKDISLTDKNRQPKDNSYLEKDGKVYKLKDGKEARGAEGIEKGLKEIDAAKNTPPRVTGSVAVITDYKAEKITPTLLKHLCNTFYEHYTFTDLTPGKPDGATPLSPKKMCELAVNIADGKGAAVVLGDGVLVGSKIYTVELDGKCIDNQAPGTPPKIGLKAASEGAFTKDCKPDAETDPGSGQLKPGALGQDSPGGPGGPGGAGGLQSILPLLPLLMQMLNPQGQGGQQGQGQGQYGAGYGNQQGDCFNGTVEPVCGNDGQTYKNRFCLSQFGTTLKNNGVCVQATPSPTPVSTPNVAQLLNQLSTSGVPSTLVESLKNIIAQILASVTRGVKPAETVVR